MKFEAITEERRNTLNTRFQILINSPDSCDPVSRNYREVARLVKDTISIIEDEKRWTKGSYAKKHHKDGTSYTIDLHEADETTCFCAIGALTRAAMEYDDLSSCERRQVYNSALNELGAAARYIDWGSKGFFDTLMSLNDNTDHSCVMKAFKAVESSIEHNLRDSI